MSNSEQTDEGFAIVKKANIDDFSIPETTKDYLLNIGLPDGIDNQLNTELGLIFMPSRVHLVKSEDKNYLIIGKVCDPFSKIIGCYGVIGIQEKTGFVYLLIHDMDNPNQFLQLIYMNSSLDALISIVKLYNTYHSKKVSLWNELEQGLSTISKNARRQIVFKVKQEAIQLYDAIKQDILRIDASALRYESDDLYWLNVLENILSIIHDYHVID